MTATINELQSSQNFIIDTLVFSKNMQKAGMNRRLSDQLANNVKEIQFDFIKTLITKDEFRSFQKDVNLEIKDLRKDIKDLQNDVNDLQNDVKDLQNDVKYLQKDMNYFKDEIRNNMQDFQKEIKEDIQDFRKEIQNEIQNLISKQEFYSEIKNLSLNLTIKMGVIMGTGIGIIGILTKF